MNIKKIASITGFSVSTVSKALNNYPDISEKTKNKILDAAKEFDYIPNRYAQSLVKRKTNTIGVVYEIETGFTSSFFTSIFHYFREVMEKEGYDILLLSNHSAHGLDYLEQSKYQQVDGLLFLASGRNQDVIHKIKDANLPMVFVDAPIKNKYTVSSNNTQGIYQAMKYLTLLGHQRIGFIGGGLHQEIGKTRLDAYLSFCNELNLEPYYIKDKTNVHYSFEEGISSMQNLFLEYGLLDAVLCSSDTLAFGATSFLKSSGFNIPEDISIIGFDDSNLCELSVPKLTSVHQNVKEIGTEAASLLLKQINKEIISSSKVTVPTSLVIRESTSKK